MEIAIIVLLVMLILLILWDRLGRRRALEQQGDTLAKTVGDRLGDATKVFGDVRESLGVLTERAKRIQEVGENISSLQELLRPPKLRGQLGELLLERLLTQILPQGCYTFEHQFQNGTRVDAVIHLGEKLVPIDAKFPLEDFERMLKAESEAERKALRRQFIRTVQKHVDDVTKYIVPDEATLDFALMYIPAENVYYETILNTQEDDLYKYFMEKRVIPVSPSTFYAYLQAIELGLRGLRIQDTARELMDNLSRLQGDLNAFQKDWRTLGEHLSNADKKYSEAERKLARLSGKLQQAGGGAGQELIEPGEGFKVGNPEQK